MAAYPNQDPQKVGEIAWLMGIHGSRLLTRERFVLTMYYGLDGVPPMSLREVGEVLDLSTERVRQLRLITESKLKAWERGRILRG